MPLNARPLRTDWKRPPGRGTGERLEPATSNAVWERFLGYMATMSAAAAARQPGMPSRVAFVMKRRRDPDYARRADIVMASRKLETSGRKPITQQQWDAFLARVGSVCIKPLCREPGMPSEAAVYKRRAKDQAFAAVLATTLRERLVLRLTAALAARGQTRRSEQPLKPTKACKPSPPPMAKSQLPVGEAFRRALHRDTLYAAVATALPKHLDLITRDDVAADMVLAVLAGELPADAIAAAVPTFLRQHRRLFGTAGVVSLDAPLRASADLTLANTLAGDASDYWERGQAQARGARHG